MISSLHFVVLLFDLIHERVYCNPVMFYMYIYNECCFCFSASALIDIFIRYHGKSINWK